MGKKRVKVIFQYSGFLDRPLTVALLLGDLTQLKKQKVQDSIASGEIDLAIGTHALIQKGVSFRQLGLVVVDEQHRFGVEQRSALRQKGSNPHVLVMTATPIPANPGSDFIRGPGPLGYRPASSRKADHQDQMVEARTKSQRL